MVLDNRTPSAGDSVLEEGSPQETMVGRREGVEVLGNRAKLNILCPLWRRKEDKCVCVCVCVRVKEIELG
jgi:hypothetical protein